MKKDKNSDIIRLRQKAETLLKNETSKAVSHLSVSEIEKLILELEVHQLELKLQNEELLMAKSDVQIAADKYTELYDFAPSGYFTFSQEGEIIDLNFSGAKMLGKKREDLKLSRFGFFVSDDTKPIFNHFLESVFESRVKESCDVTLLVNDDLPLYVQLIGTISKNADQCVVTLNDITARKQLSDLNETFLSSLPHPAMYIRRKDRVVLGANKIALDLGVKIGGYCWREFMKTEFISERDKKSVAKYPDSVSANLGIKCSFCLSDECFSGSPEQNNPEVHAFGSIWNTYWIKVSHDVYLHYAIDITELRKAEISLKRNRVFLQTIYDQSGIATFIVKVLGEGKYEYEGVNKSYEKLFGIKNEEIEGKSPSELEYFYGSETIEYVYSIYNTCCSTKKMHESEFEVSLQNGTKNWWHSRLTPLINNQGSVYRIIGSSLNITERKVAEKKLLQSEKHYRELADSISDIFFEMDNDLRYTYWNKASENFLGISAQTAIGKTLYELFPDTPGIRAAAAVYLDVLITKKSRISESTFYAGDKEVNFEIRAYPTENGLSVFTSNITDRKIAEKELSLQNDGLSKLIQFSIDLSMLSLVENLESLISKKLKEFAGAIFSIFSEYDPVYKTTTPKHIEMDPGLLKKAVSLLGKQVYEIKSVVSDELYKEMTKDIIGTRKTLYDLSFGAIPRPVGAAVQALLKVDRFIGIAFMVEGKLYGTSILAMSKSQPDPPRQILESFVALSAVSLRRKKAELALEESEKRYRVITENSVDGVVVFEGDIVKFVSQGFLNSLGYKKDEIENLNLSAILNFIHQDDAPRIKKIIETAYFEQEKIIHYSYRIRAKNGDYIWFEDTGTVDYDSSGGHVRTIFHSRNITKRKKAEEEIDGLNEVLEQRVIERTAELKESLNEMESFCYSVSHDLRAPVRHIKGFADILKDNYYEQLPVDAKHCLDTIDSASQKMGTLIDDLLRFTKTSLVELRKSPIKMNELLDDVLSQVKLSVENRKIDWKVSSLPDVKGDYDLLLHVWFNLLDNAVKFTKTREIALISVGFKDEKEEFIFFIQDNGVGFDMKYLHKLFGVFQSLHSPVQFDGTGIGLADVRKIISRHGGRTWAEADVDKGATFYFSLPK